MVIKDGAKMSKSRGNVVSADQMIDRFGADTGRLFELFAVPPEKEMDWTDAGGTLSSVDGKAEFEVNANLSAQFFRTVTQ